MEIKATKDLPPEGVSFACRLEAEATAAFITARQDPSQLDAALASMEAARARAAAATFVHLELQIRLMLGQARGAAGRTVLATLARDAAALDFTLVARKAKATK
jgi:hypothetical protein